MALMSASDRIGSAADGLGRPSDVKREVLRREEAGSSLRKLNSIMLSGGASRVSAAVCSVIISFFSFSLFSWFVLLRRDVCRIFCEILYKWIFTTCGCVVSFPLNRDLIISHSEGHSVLFILKTLHNYKFFYGGKGLSLYIKGRK